MNVKKKSLETDIIKAVESQISSSHALSEKAKERIKKSATKLAEKLSELFHEEEKKASEKASTKEVADDDSPKEKKRKKEGRLRVSMSSKEDKAKIRPEPIGARKALSMGLCQPYSILSMVACHSEIVGFNLNFL